MADQVPEGVLTLLRSAARAADCRRRQVGAVYVDEKQAIVGVGWNGLPNGSCTAGACPRGLTSYEETPAFTSYRGNCEALHAEDSAFRAAGEATGGTMYVTCEPCPGCAELCEARGARVEVVIV